MGFFKRLSRIFKSNINAVLDAAEDPEKSLEQLIREMRLNYKEAKNQVAGAMVDEKKMKRNLLRSEEDCKKWMQKAQMAVQRGNDQLAKEALGKVKTSKQLVLEYGKQVQQQSRAVQNLRDALAGLEKKIEQAKRKQQILVAKKRTVEATKTIHKTVSTLKLDTGAFDEFERLADRIEEMEDKANVMLEIGETNLEEKFTRMEMDDDLDDELSMLKLEMGVGGEAPKQLENKSKIVPDDDITIESDND